MPASLPTLISFVITLFSVVNFVKGSEDDGLQVCYGADSICEDWLDMDDQCQLAKGKNEDYDKWTQCLCESGWLAVHQACQDCEDLYGMSDTPDGPYWSSICSSSSFSIGPIPSSIYNEVSSHNAILTIILSSTYFPSGGPAAAAAPTSAQASGAESSSKSTRSVVHTSSKTPNTINPNSFPSGPITTRMLGTPSAPVPTIVVTTVSAATGTANGSAVARNVGSLASFQVLVAAVVCFAIMGGTLYF